MSTIGVALRPTSAFGKLSGISAVGAGSVTAAVDDVVTQPAGPDMSDYVRVDEASFDLFFGFEVGDPPAHAYNSPARILWVYASIPGSNSLYPHITTGSGSIYKTPSLGTLWQGGAAWRSLGHIGTLLPSEHDGIEAYFGAFGAGTRIYAVYIEHLWGSLDLRSVV